MTSLLAKCVLILCCSLINAVSADEARDVLGIWLNAAGDGHIEISLVDDELIGIIVGSTDLNSADRRDINNPDPALQTKKLQGLQIFGGLHYQGNNKWQGGWIYDPNNGKRYQCKLRLKDVDTLVLRGYIGFSLIGRSEQWQRKPAV